MRLLGGVVPKPALCAFRAAAMTTTPETAPGKQRCVGYDRQAHTSHGNHNCNYHDCSTTSFDRGSFAGRSPALRSMSAGAAKAGNGGDTPLRAAQIYLVDIARCDTDWRASPDWPSPFRTVTARSHRSRGLSSGTLVACVVPAQSA